VADPTKFDLSDWVSIIGASVLSGIGAAAAWFNSSKNRLHARLDFVEADMRKWDESHALHTTEIAIVKTIQENTSEQLEKINITTRDTNDNLKELSQQMTQILLSIQSRKDWH
jgi:SpoVK/Ycf46/Vps4 family AAA+-type ATPase